MNGKALFYISVLFTIMLVTFPSMVLAYPTCGSHYFTKTSYPDNAQGRTSIFTTKDWRAIYAVHGPFVDFYETSSKWYDPSGNLVLATPPWANSTVGAHWFYVQGVPVCIERYFYISGNGEAREPGQYRIEFYARDELHINHLLFTDYFQICMNETFQVNVDEAIFNVNVLSNSTLSNFNFNETEKKITFNVTGPDDTLGFCNVTIPNSLLQDLWQDNCTVLVDGKQPLTIANWTDGTYTYIYFTYLHSEHKVEIIPEFPSWTSMLLILIALTVTIVIYKRRLHKHQSTKQLSSFPFYHSQYLRLMFLPNSISSLNGKCCCSKLWT